MYTIARVISRFVFFYELLIFTMLLIIQFYTKLEEKHKALEAEKDEAEARKKVRTS